MNAIAPASLRKAGRHSQFSIVMIIAMFSPFRRKYPARPDTVCQDAVEVQNASTSSPS